jgi:hypothetical protein
MFDDRTPLLLGRCVDTKAKVTINHDARSTHMQIVGASNRGKSKFIEHMIREDIRKKRGLCLIDPHGSVYDNVLNWMKSKGYKRKVILFNPADNRWTFAFNPLRQSSKEISYQVDSMVRACAKVWGGGGTLDQTPLLKRCLRCIFYVLAEKGLTLNEAQYLVSPVNEAIRLMLTSDIQSEVFKAEWDYFNGLRPKEYYDEFGSSSNRLIEFLASPIIRRILGQKERVVDFRKLMDEGWILLVNLSLGNTISEENVRLLGTLLVNDLFLNARERPTHSRPFYLYIDEFSLFVNEDIARILDECRKFGLYAVLAHQHLAQLKEKDKIVYSAVMTDAQTKVIFGGLTPADTRILSEQIYMGEFDIDEIKHTLQNPMVVAHNLERVKSFMQSHSVGWGTGANISHGESSGLSSGISDSASFPILGLSTSGPFPIAMNEGTSNNSARGNSVSRGESSFHTESETQAESDSPMLIPKMEERMSSVQFRNLEEQMYRAMSLMTNQPPQYALLKIPNEKVQIIKAEDVRNDYVRSSRINRYVLDSYNCVDFIQPTEKAEEEIRSRTNFLKEKAEEHLRFAAPPAATKPTGKKSKKKGGKNVSDMNDPDLFW